MAGTEPNYAGNWFFTMVFALNLTIFLREGKLTSGPLVEKYGLDRKAVYIAYADHYLQMRSDACNPFVAQVNDAERLSYERFSTTC